jgi:hypothetical protein
VVTICYPGRCRISGLFRGIHGGRLIQTGGPCVPVCSLPRLQTPFGAEKTLWPARRRRRNDGVDLERLCHYPPDDGETETLRKYGKITSQQLLLLVAMAGDRFQNQAKSERCRVSVI